MKAKYVQRGESLDYTPEVNVAAGDVVFIGDLAAVAKLDIRAGTLGALAVAGVYDFAKDENAVAAGAKVYWNGSTFKAGATAGNNKAVGIALEPAAAEDETVRVLLNAAVAGGASETGFTPTEAAAIADVTEAGESSANLITAVNSILETLRTNGLVATGE